MLLGHAGSAGGANVEALILAIPMIVLGVMFFVQKSTKPIVSGVLVAGGIVVAIGAFTFLGGSAEADRHEEDERYVEMLAGLCEARAEVGGDPAAARLVFLDQAHAPLHSFAVEVEERDRAVAGRLLQAKQAVESGFADEGVDPARMEDDLDELIGATESSLSVLGIEQEGCS